MIEIENSLPRKEATGYIDQYTLNLNKDPNSNPKPTLMVRKSSATFPPIISLTSTTLKVIKRMAKSKAKQRLEALGNWRVSSGTDRNQQHS